jgi:ElaB/YqjD/DUF883 family membrane-anchored ribosome-binding protein
MRDRGEIEREIKERSDDLTDSIQELRGVARERVDEIKDKINVPKRAREVASAATDRLAGAARELQGAARERPRLFIAIAAGVVVGALIALKLHARRRASD